MEQLALFVSCPSCFLAPKFLFVRLTVCVTCVWAGVDSVREQEKLEARKMLENGDDWAREQSAATIAHPSAWALGIPTCSAHALLRLFIQD